MTPAIQKLYPRTTTGVVPVSEEYLTQFAEAIIRKCARMAECERNREPGKFIIEHFGLK